MITYIKFYCYRLLHQMSLKVVLKNLEVNWSKPIRSRCSGASYDEVNWYSLGWVVLKNLEGYLLTHRNKLSFILKSLCSNLHLHIQNDFGISRMKFGCACCCLASLLCFSTVCQLMLLFAACQHLGYRMIYVWFQIVHMSSSYFNQYSIYFD